MSGLLPGEIGSINIRGLGRAAAGSALEQGADRMPKTILITGGAGFIGSHAAGELIGHGWRVRALDNLTPQIHETGERPAYLDDDVELVVGDVRDPDAVRSALDGADAVLHLAARVGV